MEMLIVLSALLGILNGIMDDRRDWFPEDYFSRLYTKLKNKGITISWLIRTPDDRKDVAGYGSFFLWNLIVEYFNDVWHTVKLIMFLGIFLILAPMIDSVVWDGVLAAFSFAIGFQVSYHVLLKN